MTATVAALWRHPIKSHGREALEAVTLQAGQTLPWDRAWAVTHEDSHIDPAAPAWGPSQNFMIGTRTPGLAGIWARLDEDSATVTLTHDELGEITVAPDDRADAARLLDWVAPLCPANRSRPAAVIRLPDRGVTDTDYPSVSVMNMASHRAVADRLGSTLEPERWRGNIWLDGLAPWAEEGWIGQRLRIGTAELTIREPVVRCLHTAANPRTGQRDADTLGALDALRGERHFGLYAEVTTGGRIALGDSAEVLE
ncbi:MAG: MOSC domain-containing protein [Limimaricola sp.]|uniref:MOSC domain-containing protein n=1 Tax=Limimaricola sp. TaxID=2211665 RepID=UPI001D7C8A63|nr:MOSC domain-containing protein [Limimaricola sp.]MBI1415627.1 MOSC domain-containing protein [Limimaricola sp.]